jgi:hypothetical protein
MRQTSGLLKRIQGGAARRAQEGRLHAPPVVPSHDAEALDRMPGSRFIEAVA